MPDGSIRAGTDVRLTMLAVLGMVNSVINWRQDDQARDLRRIAAELGKFVVNGLAAPGTAYQRKRP